MDADGKPLVLVLRSDDYYGNDLTEHLREILSKLHYETRECSSCGWITHEDETKKWTRCFECGRAICDTCVDDTEGATGANLSCCGCNGD